MGKRMWRHERKAAIKGFGKGIVVGAVLGGIVAAFLSPKSGAEHREMVRRNAKKVTKSDDQKLTDLNRNLSQRIDTLKGVAGDLRGDAYEEGHRLLTRAELIKQDLQDVVSSLTTREGADRDDLLKDAKRLIADGGRVLGDLERIARKAARRQRDEDDR